MFGDDAAYRLIARTSWPFEREETRDAWAVTMRDRPDLLATEVAAARARLEAAVEQVFRPGSSGDSRTPGSPMESPQVHRQEDQP